MRFSVIAITMYCYSNTIYYSYDTVFFYYYNKRVFIIIVTMYYYNNALLYCYSDSALLKQCVFVLLRWQSIIITTRFCIISDNVLFQQWVFALLR